MAQNTNIVVISGNLTRDAELKQIGNGGTVVLRFGIASNTSTKTASGKWEDKPNFVNCVMFGNRAEAIAQYMRKGQKVAITGQLSYSSWEKNGEHRSALEIRVNNVELLGSRQASNGQDGAYSASQTQATPVYNTPDAISVADDDIPF